MVEQSPPSLDLVFRALADPTRRGMLRELAEHDRSISELAEPLDMSLAAASKHVRSLERAGLIHRTRQGRTHICRINPRPLADVREWLAHYERFWTDRLDALEALLKADDATPRYPKTRWV